jgi:hypothetical protein
LWLEKAAALAVFSISRAPLRFEIRLFCSRRQRAFREMPCPLSF